MAQLRGGHLVLRSLLFVPGHQDSLALKAAASNADCVVLDLQDAVPPQAKVEARVSVRKTLDSGVLTNKAVWVRVNPWASGLTQLDLDAVSCGPLRGFVYPMAGSRQDIEAMEAALDLKEKALDLDSGHFDMIPTVETAGGLIHAYEIASASARVVALLFGAEDFMSELQGRQDSEQRVLQTPRALIAIAARAVGVEPIDTPYLKVHDLEGLKAHAERARDLGMSGMAVLTPRQIPVVHEVYTPSDKEIRGAEQIVNASEEAARAGRAIAVTNGMFVDSPVERRARKLLARAEAIKNRELRSSALGLPHRETACR